GHLIFAHRHPRAAETRPVKVVRRDDADDHEDHHQDVKRERIDEVEHRQELERLPVVPRPAKPEWQRGWLDAGNPVHPAGPVSEDRSRPQVAEDPWHDLAESQRYDRQVIAAEPQRRCPQQRPEAGRGEHADEQQQPEWEMDLVVQGTAIQLARGEHADGVGVDGEEGRVAGVEEAGIPDHDIQPDGEQDIHARVGGLVDQGAAAPSGENRREEGKGQGAHEEQSIDDRIAVAPATCDGAQPRWTAPAGRAHFSGTRMPSSPVGRKTRTRIKMLKIQTSVSWEVKYLSLKALTRPMYRPPMAAPRMLPFPPKSAAVKAKSQTT